MQEVVCASGRVGGGGMQVNKALHIRKSWSAYGATFGSSIPHTHIQPNGAGCVYNLSTGPSAVQSFSRVLSVKISRLRTTVHWCCVPPACTRDKVFE